MAKPALMTTPRGRAIYPHLNTPDTKFNAEGEYKLKLAIPTAQAEKLTEAIDKALQQVIEEEKKKNPKLKKVKEAGLPYALNDENEDETIFSFKMKASGVVRKTKEKFTQKPNIYDAKGKLCNAKVGGGSIVRVSFELNPYYTAALGAGVSLRLKAVQVLELRAYGSGDAKSYGFEAEEDGFSADDAPEETSAGSGEAQEDERAETEADESETSGDASDF